MSISQRNKGASGEREIVHMIDERLGIKARRNLEQVRSGGCDIELLPYRIEVKRRKSFNTLYKWIHQAEEACDENTIPVVMTRADGERWVAIVPAEHFLDLSREKIVWERVKKPEWV